MNWFGIVFFFLFCLLFLMSMGDSGTSMLFVPAVDRSLLVFLWIYPPCRSFLLSLMYLIHVVTLWKVRWLIDVMFHLPCIPLQRTKVESGPGFTSHLGRVGSGPDFTVHLCPPAGGINKARGGARELLLAWHSGSQNLRELLMWSLLCERQKKGLHYLCFVGDSPSPVS